MSTVGGGRVVNEPGINHLLLVEVKSSFKSQLVCVWIFMEEEGEKEERKEKRKSREKRKEGGKGKERE